MDFSSIPRALDSLQRRQPPMDAAILETVEQLRDATDPETFTRAAERLIVDATRWESLAVGLLVTTELLAQKKKGTVYMDGPRVPSTDTSASCALPELSEEQTTQLCNTLHRISMEHLEHSEPRVRTMVAKAIAAYVVKSSLEVRQGLHQRLISSIHQHIQQGRDDAASKYSRSTNGALDDTTGWRALETNWQCLASQISAMGSDYWREFPCTGDLLSDVEYSCVTHVNRHVRAAGMAVLEQAVIAATEHDDVLQGPLRKTIKSVVKTGLADNWSQVRMAASVLCRVFLVTLQAQGDNMDDIFPVLLPRMCLNRFYMAQGVRLYSLETWKLVFPTQGLELVVQFLPAVVRYYVQMCDADNHAVREAACQAIAELAVRLGNNQEYREALADHVSTLLQALIMCFHDESWPVRDEACMATGTLCKCFPEDCRPEFKLLWERWTEQLTDQIWSVRRDAAVALGDALDAYGSEVWKLLQKDLIPKILPAARDQPAMTAAEFKAHVNDIEKHTNTQLYSCGSLAPKLGKTRKDGAGRIGCSSCGIDRPKAPWEATDGCIYLLKELCVKSGTHDMLNDDALLPLLTELADVCRVQHFPQSDELRTTLFKLLPDMAHALGKQRFKAMYLEVFVDLMFRTIESRSASALAQHAARQCALELAQLVGPAIFRARLADEMQQRAFDEIVREEQIGNGNRMMDGPALSPFASTGLIGSAPFPH